MQKPSARARGGHRKPPTLGGMGGVPATRQITGGGLATGGGDLTADRVITVTPAILADIAELHDDTAAPGVLVKAAAGDHRHAHGNRGGGPLHAAVTEQANGFMLAGDKILVNGHFSNKGANLVWAGPPTGGDAPPTWRNLVIADLPVSERELRVHCRITGTLAGTKYASPGTIANGVAADVKLTRLARVGAGPAPSWLLSALWVDAETAPGMGESLIVTVRKFTNGGAWGDTAMVVSLTDAETSESTESNQPTFSGLDYPGLKLVASGASIAANVDLHMIFTRLS